ncbi:MAG: hypothetical protein JWN46_2504 [Acidimicrobiales bacterium]|nr:hypothetical protein [Acidimicrobiales bacterium]
MAASTTDDRHSWLAAVAIALGVVVALWVGLHAFPLVGMHIHRPRAEQERSTCAVVQRMRTGSFSPVSIVSSPALKRESPSADAASVWRFAVDLGAVPAAYAGSVHTFFRYVDNKRGEQVSHPPTQVQAIAAARRMEEWSRTCRAAP